MIESEQGIIVTLQSALINHLKPVSGIEIGKVYISATDGAAVGGDFSTSSRSMGRADTSSSATSAARA